jgi:hypothetical protein
MILIRALFLILSFNAYATIWNGMEEAPIPVLKPVDLKNVKKVALRGSCVGLLSFFASSFANDLSLIRGKTISYPRQSKKVGKYLQRLEKVYLDISDPTQDFRNASLIAQGLGLDLKVSEFEARIKKFRSRNFKKVSLVEFLPDFVKKEMGQVLDCDGPNCYNTSMRFHQIEKEQFETFDYEVVQHIQNKYKALEPNAELKFGDLIVFWLGDGDKGYQGNIRHTAIYMGQGIVLHKASMSKGDPVTFEELQGVMDYYREKRSTDPSSENIHSITFHRLK